MCFIQASPKHAALFYSTSTQTTWTLRCHLFPAFTEPVGGSARSSLVLFCALYPVPLLLFTKGQFPAPAHSSALMTLQNTSAPTIKCHSAGSGDTNSTVFRNKGKRNAQNLLSHKRMHSSNQLTQTPPFLHIVLSWSSPAWTAEDTSQQLQCIF